MKTNINYIRNFSIIAHIDHGKSTLADRLIYITGALHDREMKQQVLDSMDIEKERGITIKAQTVRLNYQDSSKNKYILNLIDTPGHADFSYEVSRSLASCEGSLLVVDATQGVEAQTLVNANQAIENNHKIIAIINKVDLPSANPDLVKRQIQEIIGIDTKNAIMISAKTGLGIKKVLQEIIRFLPPPNGDCNGPLKAMLVDSWYDPYVGVIVLVRIIDGTIKKGQHIKMLGTGAKYIIENVGFFTPKIIIAETLSPGEFGFITASIKKVADTKIGDTITEESCQCLKSLPGFKLIKPVVFCGIFPIESRYFNDLKLAVNKLQLNDASFSYEVESSEALGFGFRCGFLGMLHLEIIQERLEREFNLQLIATVPSVIYRINMKNNSSKNLYNPSEMPNSSKISSIEEPWIQSNIIIPNEYIGNVINFCQERRGIQINLTYIDRKIILTYDFPLNEIIFDFYDHLKSLSKGYASFDYKIINYKKADIVKMSVLINGKIIDALSVLVHRPFSEKRGRYICKMLKDLIPKHMFQISLQASIDGKIIARETIHAFRKDVTAKCYGGDITRKRKLLEKQRDGKKKMKKIGNVEIPKKAFIQALKIKNNF